MIHGLNGDRVGLLTQIHHAMIDGMSGAEVMGVLFDLDENGREAPSSAGIGSDREPGQFEMLARGIFGLPRYPVRALRSLPRALPMIDETAFGTIPGIQTIAKLAERTERLFSRNNEGGLLERTTMKAPRTSFNGKVSPHRRFVFGQLTLEEVKAVKNEYGCTVNDVVVSICAGAVRRWLIEHQELPEDPLVAQVPVSVRTSAQQGTYGNRIMLMSAPLMTNVVDPVERLNQTHEALMSMKDRHRALPAELLQDANHFIPPAVFSRAARTTLALSTGQARPAWNLVISNVPGPQFPLYCCGAKVEANYPVSVITDGMGLNITVMSYMGHMDFGIVADRDQMPDLWRLIDYLRDELEELRPAKSTADADVTADV
ncbi:hypothetical protein BH10ACT11_BH10ACT11_21690 [soil metagenome]